MLTSWVVLVAAFGDDSGLGFQGDSPRHASNGVFWRDLIASPTLDVRNFALRYYARYPAINPVTYPPVYYLAEAAGYAMFGVSAWTARATSTAFALLIGVYVLLWLRRWLGVEGGWIAGLALLTPGVARWSNAVMLNAPAAALAVATLYHASRWLEDARAGRRSWHLYLTGGFGVLASLTWLPTGYLVLVILAWVLWLGPRRVLIEPRVLATGFVSLLLVSPWLYLVWRHAPYHVSWATPDPGRLGHTSQWTFYAGVLTTQVHEVLLVAAAVGVAVGFATRAWRRGAVELALWIAVGYVCFTMIVGRESRYLLSIVPATAMFAAAALVGAGRLLRHMLRGRPKLAWSGWGVAVAAMLLVGAWTVAHTPTRRVEGFDRVAAWVAERAPAEPVFYDGHHNGVFTFHVLAGDPDRQRRVAVGHKAIYASALHGKHGLEEFVDDRGELVRRLRESVGARWILIEIGEASAKVDAAKLLREAVHGPEFEFVRSFPVVGSDVTRVDAYRLLGEVREVEEVALPFPLAGGQSFTVKPIE